ncbi:MAG: hypothetical protein H7319_14115 [Spirosoma sp.]|nr:hypothetical protein [Spirosoma sp.]
MFRILLFTLFLAIVFFVAEQYAAVSWLHPAWKTLLVFYLSVSFLTHRLVGTGLQDNPDRFIPMYMAATVSRFILALLFVGFSLWQGIENRRAFILDFLVLYIVYLGFEIWGFTRKLRPNSKNR